MFLKNADKALTLKPSAVTISFREDLRKREVKYLANIKSAKKRINVTNKRYMRNKAVKSSTRTVIKKVVTAAAAGQLEQAQAEYRNAVSAIDKAASKGVYHKNTASRRKSRLAKMLNRTAAAQ